jgi:hypothetical protein
MEWQEAWERAQQRADDLQIENERIQKALQAVADCDYIFTVELMDLVRNALEEQ